MSRHRSPGRSVPPSARPASTARTPDERPAAARHPAARGTAAGHPAARHTTAGRPPVTSGPGRPARDLVAPGLRHALAAAAVAGGALAVAVPVATTTTEVAARSLASEALPPTPPGTGRAVAGRRLASVVLVEAVPDPEPAGFSVAGLLKSTGLAGAQACDADLGGLGHVKPWVRAAARFLSCLHGRPDLIGVAGRARHSDHPAGLAVDFLMRGERGDRLAACALANQEALGISYVIWEQRINFGDGWQRMEDRGGDTENHVDHVHVSFERRPGTGDPQAARCT